MEEILDKLKSLKDKCVKRHEKHIQEIADRCGSVEDAVQVCSGSATLALAEFIDDKIKALEGGKENE